MIMQRNIASLRCHSSANVRDYLCAADGGMCWEWLRVHQCVLDNYVLKVTCFSLIFSESSHFYKSSSSLFCLQWNFKEAVEEGRRRGAEQTRFKELHICSDNQQPTEGAMEFHATSLPFADAPPMWELWWTVGILLTKNFCWGLEKQNPNLKVNTFSAAAKKQHIVSSFCFVTL